MVGHWCFVVHVTMTCRCYKRVNKVFNNITVYLIDISYPIYVVRLYELLSSPWTHRRLTASYLLPHRAENWVKGEWCHWLLASMQRKETLLSSWRWQECCGFKVNIKPMHYCFGQTQHFCDKPAIVTVSCFVHMFIHVFWKKPIEYISKYFGCLSGFF